MVIRPASEPGNRGNAIEGILNKRPAGASAAGRLFVDGQAVSVCVQATSALYFAISASSIASRLTKCCEARRRTERQPKARSGRVQKGALDPLGDVFTWFKVRPLSPLRLSYENLAPSVRVYLAVHLSTRTEARFLVTRLGWDKLSA